LETYGNNTGINMRRIFKNVKVVMPTGIIDDGIVIAEDGIISKVGSAAEISCSAHEDGAEIIDGEG